MEKELKGASIRNDAIGVELKLRKYFDCNVNGLGGTIEAGFIETGGMYTVLAMALAVEAERNHIKKDSINNFLGRYVDYNGKRIRDIIQESGEEEVTRIIEEFDAIIEG